MSKPPSGDTPRMPGTPRQEEPGIADYVIVLKEDDEESENADRRVYLQSGLAKSVAFLRSLRSSLRKRGFDDRTVVFGEPTSFGILAVRCTPEIARIIADMPEVEGISRDLGGIAFSGT